MKTIRKYIEMQKPSIFFKYLDFEELSKYKGSDEIDTKYIINCLCEPFYKEMIEVYMKKIVMNGYFTNIEDFLLFLYIKSYASA